MTGRRGGGNETTWRDAKQLRDQETKHASIEAGNEDRENKKISPQTRGK